MARNAILSARTVLIVYVPFEPATTQESIEHRPSTRIDHSLMIRSCAQGSTIFIQECMGEAYGDETLCTGLILRRSGG